MINFLGLGAQKAGTSWVYACLYEHPEICAPIKEIHFFSRPRYEKGKNWYESHFRTCKNGSKQGEFSTSYLYSKEAPGRIHTLYPDVKLIAILRNPIDRAYSEYQNAIKAGEITRKTSFDTYAKSESSCLAQGRYTQQLKRYFTYFKKDQILILIYEDSRKDPAGFIKRIYEFLEIDPYFVPSMLHTEINIERTPRSISVEKIMHICAETLRTIGLHRLVHAMRRSGLPDRVRSLNTRAEQNNGAERKRTDDMQLKKYFTEDVRTLSELLDRNLLYEWDIKV